MAATLILKLPISLLTSSSSTMGQYRIRRQRVLHETDCEATLAMVTPPCVHKVRHSFYLFFCGTLDFPDSISERSSRSSRKRKNLINVYSQAAARVACSSQALLTSTKHNESFLRSLYPLMRDLLQRTTFPPSPGYMQAQKHHWSKDRRHGLEKRVASCRKRTDRARGGTFYPF